MGSKRIYLGREVSKYAEIAGGAILTITALFFVLMAVGLEITGSDDQCLGTLEDPCVSYGKICNLGPDNYDIYNPEGFKMDFSPTIENYWIFFKDGRVKKEFLIPKGIDHSTAGWRYENFTDATKPRKDRVYVHRFARYSCQDYMLVGLKEDPDDIIKWGVGVGKEYLDPFWYGLNASATISISDSLTLELGTEINISGNVTGTEAVCFNIDHPEYGDDYKCGGGITVMETGNDFACAENFTSCAECNDGNWSSWTYGTENDFIIYENYTITSLNPDSIEFIVKLTAENDDGNVSYWNYTSGAWTNLVTITNDSINTFTLTIPADGYTETNVRLRSLIEGDGVFDSGFYYEGNLSVDYGSNNFLFSIDYFRKDVFNDSSTAKNVSWTDGGNNTIYIQGHQYDEFNNLSLSFTGFEVLNTIPEDVKIYVNGSLSNTLWDFYEGFTTSIDEFNETLSSQYLNWTAPGIKYMTIKAFKGVDSTSALINFTSIGYTGIGDKEFDFSDEVEPPFEFVRGIEFDGTNIYQVGNYIRKYDKEGTYIEEGSVLSGVDARGITSCGGDILYISDADDDTVKLYGKTNYSFMSEFAIAPNTNPRGIGCNGTHIFLTDYNLAKCYAYVYEIDGTYINTIDFTAENAANGMCWGIDQDQDGNWWTADWTDRKFYRYNSTFEYNSVNYDIGVSGRNPLDIAINDSQMYFAVSAPGSSYAEAYLFYVNSTTKNTKFEGGVLGTVRWNVTERFVGVDTSNDFSTDFDSFMDDCIEDSDGFCYVGLSVYSEESGIILVDTVNVSVTYNPNPVTLDYDLINDFLSASTGSIAIPITIEASSNGTLQTGTVSYDYAGGNDTIEIFVYEKADVTNNDTIDLLHYYSDWDYAYPTYIDWLEFIPKTPTTKNVSAFGQTPVRPIFNITNYGYGGMDSNFTIILNESHACVNLSLSLNENKTDSLILNDTWTSLFTGFSYGESNSLWMWADYECNYTTWKLWEPELSFRNCCEECICSEDT